MAKPNKENIITEMLIELKKGISYSECLEVIGGKWRLSESTFLRYWNEANTRHQTSQLEQQKVINEQSIKGTQKIIDEVNITKESLLKELEEVKALAKVPDNAGRINTQAVIKAIEVQAKMLGLNEAQKQELIINKGFYLELDKDGE
jgi:hypothetical protein